MTGAMIAGAALARGMAVRAIGEGLPGLITAATPEAAMADLVDLRKKIEPGLSGEDIENIPDRLAGIKDNLTSVQNDLLRKELLDLRRSAIFHRDRHACTMAALDKLIRGTPLQAKFFEIVGNGSPSGESPVYAQRLNMMRHRLESLEERLAPETPGPG